MKTVYKTYFGPVPFQARCYQFEGKPASEQRSDFPPLSMPGVSWHLMDNDLKTRQVPEEEGRKTLNLWGHTRCKPLQLSECPMNCSNHGSCIKVWKINQNT